MTEKKCGPLTSGGKDGWFSRKPALLSGGLTVTGGHVYVGSEKAQVYALNASDGSVAWQTTVAGESLSRPVVSDGLGADPYQQRPVAGAERSRWSGKMDG